MLDLAHAILGQLLLFVAVLTPLELLWPARDAQRLYRRDTSLDLAYFALAPFFIHVGAALLLALLGVSLHALIPRAAAASLAAQPFALQLAEIIFFSELLAYWVHRASHRVPLLWRFHAVHHSAEELDWLAAHRAHPLESVWLLGVANLPLLALGFSTESILGFVIFQKLYTGFLHANVRLDLRHATYLIATPRFHRWHHDGDDAHGRNFASLLPLFDRIFGTHALPDGEPRRLGTDEPVPRGFCAQLAYPLAPALTAPASSAPRSSSARA